MNYKRFKEFLKLSFRDQVLVGFDAVDNRVQKYLNFKGKYELVLDNKKNYENLLIIVAGYQDYLYDKVLNRVNKCMEKDIDVCVVTPGKKDNQLLEYCKNFGRSYLYTKNNKLSLAQNIAIKLHKHANFIYKMDEDIFITKGFFTKLRKKYDLCIKKSEFIPGGITPVLNINGFTYGYFLQAIDKKNDYEKTFGPLKQRAYNDMDEYIQICHSGEVAKYIRENTIKIDSVQEKYFDKIDIQKNFIANSIRYSIGCFMFPREIWENMGGFDVAQEGVLGKEEAQYLSYCTNQSRPIVICKNSLCGHFAFGRQKNEMKKYFNEHLNLF